jgi:hypothetical protein
MPAPDTVKKVGFVLGLFLGGYTIYRLLRNVPRTKTLSKAVKATVDDVIEIPEKVVDEVKKAVKIKPKKSHFHTNKPFKHDQNPLSAKNKKLYDKNPKEKNRVGKTNKSRSKGGRVTAKLGKHKGHKTKKGLSNDQKLDSVEKHEKAYRKKKARA